MTKRDVILVFSALVFFALSFFILNSTSDEKGALALAVYNEEVLAEMDLSREGEYVFGLTKEDGQPVFLKAEGFDKQSYRAYNFISVREGKVGVKEASCPDGLCTKVRPIFRNQDMIVCLPHKFYIKLVGGVGGGLDAISE